MRADSKHRAGGCPEDDFSRRAEEKTLQATASMCSHNDQVDIQLADPAGNCFFQSFLSNQRQVANACVFYQSGELFTGIVLRLSEHLCGIELQLCGDAG